MGEIAWTLADARRELLRVEAENVELRDRVLRLEQFVHAWIMGAAGQAAGEESHGAWDYGEELEAGQDAG